jgi:hypothetical protein
VDRRRRVDRAGRAAPPIRQAEPAEHEEAAKPTEKPPPAPPAISNDTGVGPAPPETVALWVKRVASMGPDEIDDFERRTFAAWDRASLDDLRRAIRRRRREFAG